MRVAFFGQSGPYAPVALHTLLQGAAAADIALVVEGRKLPMARRSHRWLPAKPGRIVLDASLADLAVAAGIPVLQTCDVNHAYVAEQCIQANVDTLVCVGFDRLFAPALLANFRITLNAHPSALPRGRGPSPLFWALRHGEALTAMTLHQIDAGEDNGAIFAQQPLPIAPRISGEKLYNAAGRLAGQMLQSLLPRAAMGGLCGVPQNKQAATRAPRPKPEDAFVEPASWNCQHLLNFAEGAPYFRAPWLRLGDDTFHVRGGLAAQPGKTMPAQYVLQGDTLVVQCRDGLTHLCIQV